jgi:flagellar motor switch protein FliM
MHKSGLAALADSYRAEHAELERLKTAAEAFFGDLRDALTQCAGTSATTAELKLSHQTCEQLCENSLPHQILAIATVAVGSGARVAALVKADGPMARALVDCIIAGAANAPEQPGPALTVIEEHLFADSFRAACIASARRTLTGLLGGADLRLLRSETGAAAMPALEPSARLLSARVTCEIGGGSGSLEIAFPAPQASTLKESPSPRPSHPPDAAASRRKLLATLGASQVGLTAVLGQVTMPLEAVRALGPGSVLILQNMRRAVAEVELHCEDQVLFSGTVVEHRGWRRFLIHRAGGFDERTEQPRFDA